MRGLYGSGNIQLRELGAFGGHLEAARAYTSLRHACCRPLPVIALSDRRAWRSTWSRWVMATSSSL